MKNNKNISLLNLYSISHIEKYLKELVNLCFEYVSIFCFSYDLNSFKTICINNINLGCENLSNFMYLLNLYLEKECFYSSLFSLVSLKAKLKSSQLFQINGIKGISSFGSDNSILLNNLHYGLDLRDFIYSSFTSRNSVIDSGLNISESGYLTRKLIESLRDTYIKCISCYTRYEYSNMFINKHNNIPFLCLNIKSVCLKCLKINYKNFALIGYNKGVICGQALGEPSTQMLLRTFHLGDKLIFRNLLNVNCCLLNFKYFKYFKYFFKYKYYSLEKLSNTVNNLFTYNGNFKSKYSSIIFCDYIQFNIVWASLIKTFVNLWVVEFLFNNVYSLNCLTKYNTFNIFGYFKYI